LTANLLRAGGADPGGRRPEYRTVAPGGHLQVLAGAGPGL